MKITRTDVSKTEIKLLISADEAELKPIKDGVVKRLSKDIKLPGFREGKVPAELAEKNIDPNMLQNDFLDEAMSQLYAKATQEKKIRPVTRPEVAIKKFVPFSHLEFEVTTNIVGEIKLADYKKLKIAKEKTAVTAKDIDDVINNLRTRLAEKVEVKRASKLKDEAVIDFKGTDKEGKAIEGAEGKDYPLELGSGAFIPGFEEEVVGLKAGDTKKFDITFPKDYGAKELAGTKVTFEITVSKVNELKLATVDDEFAAKIGPFKTVDELKDDIKKQLTAEKEREVNSKHQDAILKAISEQTEIDLPAALVDQQVTYLIDDIRRNLMQTGQTYKEFIESQGKTEESYKDEVRPQAVEQLKVSLILSEIAEKEKMTVEPSELEIRIQLLKGQYKDAAMQAELDKPENRRDIASRMLSEKVMLFLEDQIK